MSHRPHPLRQSYTVDYAAINRNPSTTSSASSGYSYNSNGSDACDSTHSSTSITSNESAALAFRHKRGMSETALRHQATPRSTKHDEPKATPESMYSLARQSLRPLPPAPASSSPPPPPPSTSTSPTKTSPRKSPSPSPRYDTRQERGKSFDMGRLSLYDGNTSPTPKGRPLPPPPPDVQPSLSPSPPPRHRHERGQSLDVTGGAPERRLQRPAPTPLSRSTAARPTSMVLTRSDTIAPGPSNHTLASPGAMVPHSHSHAHSHSLSASFVAPDLQELGRSSTSQLRTLSSLAQGASADAFAITSPAQEVVGLRGRRRLQRVGNANSLRRSDRYGFEGRNWMDKQRQFLQAYEYLCHIGEAKEWIEDIIHRNIPPIVELEEALRDGVTLAEVVEALNPTRRFRIFRHHKLQARHWDNVAMFFRYLDEVELPDLFRFELIDLYEKKNIPKVIYCIHALSWLLFRKGIVDFRIGNLVGQLEFEHHELEAMQKGLDKLGVSMPSFGNMGADFGVEPPPEPEETEEERIDRELSENEAMILDLQTQIRGALLRIQLANVMQHLWDAEEFLVDLQSRIRGDWSRQVVDYRLNMRKFAINLQSAARGFLARRQMLRREQFWKSQEKDILKLQSLIRATKVRDEVRETKFELKQVAGPIRHIQAAFRGYLARKEVVSQQKETSLMTKPAIGLQSAIRGMLARGKVEDEIVSLQEQTPAITEFQAAARAMLARNNVFQQQKALHAAGPQWQAIQASAKAMLTRNVIHEQQKALHAFGPQWKAIQASAKAMLTRNIILEQQQALHAFGPQWKAIQSAARAMLTRNVILEQQEALHAFGSQWEAIQAMGRGKLRRQEVESTKAELAQHSPELGSLQAHIRAAAVRREIADKLDALSSHEDLILDLQSFARGMLERQQVAAELDALESEEEQITDLQASIRGFLSRLQHSALLDELASHEDEIISLQSCARAMLQRAYVGELLAEIDEHEEAVVELQSWARGFIVRASFVEKKRHYDENMQKVVKIQSFVRGKLQGEAYKSLTQGKNPPVGAVKNFVHLLNDSDFDFNEEIEFERMRKTVVQQVRQNEMLEQYIDQLDIKIALLVKNKITLDEVVRHQSNFGGHASNLLANASIASANHFDLKALNKSSRKKLESYQQLFFNLQTQPAYLARLFRRIREQGTAEKECKRIEHLMMGLFGYAQKRREEYYLLKLISRSIWEDAQTCQTLQDHLRGNFFWAKLLANYTRSPRDRKYLRELLGPLIRDNIIEDPHLDLESDPMQIYRSAISNEELRTGRPSQRPLDIPRDLAIKDPETRGFFIDHLRDLREICEQFFLALEDLLPRMPYGLRFICQQTFEALCQQFPREPQHRILQMVGNWVWRFYLQPALINPEQVGVIEKSLGPLQKRNLTEVAKVLGQIASGRPFGGENIYLQPLNAFIGESIQRLAVITNDLISVADAESTFDIDEFNDLYAKNKPTLYIKMTDIFAIHTLVAHELPAICPGRDDILREIMQDLGSAKNNENEMVAAGSSDIQLFLTPKLHDVNDPEAEVKALFMETKRCILYIIRVQTGTNLLEILVRPPTVEDEHKWQALLREDFGSTSRTKGAYSDVHMIDVTRISYYDMKRNALENVMRLEQMGRISKHNFYQDILNAIAVDIRTKSRRRIQRQRELEGVHLTLGNLHDKAKYLEQQRKSYDDYIEQAMITLQKNKGKKRFLLPFTKQYNHQRELERSGRVPKFGSYKYSARQLAEKGVVVAWQGVPDRDWGNINLTISCDEVGVFQVEGSRGHIQMPGASGAVPIEDLLQAQFEAHQFITLFEGGLRLNVNLLLHLLYKKFYRTQ